MKKRPILILCMATLVFTLAFSLLSYWRYEAFFSYEWEDLSSTHYLWWNLSREGLSALKDYSHYFDTNLHIFPYVVIPSFLYRMFGNIEGFFFINALIVFFPAIILYHICKAKAFSSMDALLLGLAYLFYAPKSSLVFLDGDVSLNCIYMLFLVYLFYTKKKFKWMWLSLIPLALLRTEAPLISMIFSIFFFLKTKDKKAMMIALGFLMWFLTNMTFYSIINVGNQDLNPVLSHLSDFKLTNLTVYFMFFWQKAYWFFWALLPFFFIPLLQLEIILSLTSILLYFFLAEPLPQQGHHLSAFYATTFLALVSFLSSSKHSSRLIPLILLSCVVSNFLPNTMGDLNQTGFDGRKIHDARFLGTSNFYDPIFYRQDDESKIAWDLIRKIPSDAKVTASADLLPPLTTRKEVAELFFPGINEEEFDYVLSRKRYMYLGAGAYPFNQEKLNAIQADARQNQKWAILYEDKNFIFLKKSLR